MKKFLVFTVAILAFFSLTSCSITSEIQFFEDKTTSTEMEVDMRVFYKILKDSAFSSTNKGNVKVENFPRTYKSFYDIQVEKGRKDIPKDSARLYKKMFMKSNFENGEIVGFSIKLDRFSPQDALLYGSREENDLPMNNSILENWDGKTLKIKTSAFITEDLKELVKMMDNKDDKKSKDGKLPMNFSTTLKFEKPIKSFKGNHPWVKQLDKKTVKIQYTAEDIADATQKNQKNSEIVIVTE